MRETLNTSLARPVDLAIAAVLLTRLPLPVLQDATFERQTQAVWAFPVVGAAVALLAGSIGWIALALGLPGVITALLVLGAQIIITGAMHEDGLADSADGIWGGFDAKRRLAIMRDSHIGTYGVLALILSLGLRWGALTGLIVSGYLWGPLLVAATLSRAGLPVLMATLPHARSDGLSHRVGRPETATVAVAVLLGLGFALMGTGWLALLVATTLAAVLTGLGALAKARIGGQTGDILGAAQQLGEIAVLLTLLAVI
ncbi:adenosylcobinamide-GDP ribazoletransferase [Pontibaca salina]|uniref:Adenosylcobinamide-GDP ribazoletransferase n=1 Tax=Pontibaca salina TaxID=2795731 RepID=A0A934HSF3_9RHOB|nr:adenosylcobinamide-GDP ribazoletransferase [Pontibaca salina]MBI6629840.1 adenosylcobinamide-GDP ribazoletransferase [Pontibaca salina]